MAEPKYNNYIYFEEDEVSGINWYIARRDTKHIVNSGHCETYQQAVKESDQEFNESKA